MFRILFQLSKQTLTIVNAFIRDQNKQLLQAVNVYMILFHKVPIESFHHITIHLFEKLGRSPLSSIFMTCYFYS